jgi:hypothetical protein
MSWRSEGRCQTDLAPLFMRAPADTKKWGRGSRVTLSGRGRGRGAGGVNIDKLFEIPPAYSGQLIWGAAGVIDLLVRIGRSSSPSLTGCVRRWIRGHASHCTGIQPQFGGSSRHQHGRSARYRDRKRQDHDHWAKYRTWCSWEQVVRDRVPLTTGAVDVQDRVDNLPRVDLPGPATMLACRNQRLKNRSLCIGQVARIGFAC